jgi:hypothetical protein
MYKSNELLAQLPILRQQEKSIIAIYKNTTKGEWKKNYLAVLTTLISKKNSTSLSQHGNMVIRQETLGALGGKLQLSK